MQKQEEKDAALGVWSALSTGFDLTARHPWLLLLPMLLDLFIWLGPRLRFQAIIEQLVANVPPEVEVMEITQQLVEMGPLTNLFTVLSVPLIGVPTLLSGLTPETTPLAARALDIENGAEWAALILFLGLAGLLLTAVYYVTISFVVSSKQETADNESDNNWFARIGLSWLRLIGLAILFLLAALVVYIPVSIVGAIFFMMNATLGTFALLLAPFVLIWIIIYMSFAPPGVTLRNRPVFKAVKESLLLVQGNLTVVLAMLLFIILIGALVDWLLILAENGTWFTLFNILIHAFVSTSLVTAFFVLYEDRSARLLNEPAEVR
ncbi:MAG: hypothetical protein ACK2U5_09030 [Candidatus Promineifilaceae bacterium]